MVRKALHHITKLEKEGDYLVPANSILPHALFDFPPHHLNLTAKAAHVATPCP